MTADSVKGPWDPLSRSSSDVCCWLFSKSIKATREIPIVSLRNSHLTGFSNRGTYTIWDLLILSLSPPQILLFFSMFRQQHEIFASCLYSEASSKNNVQLLHSAASVTDLLRITPVTLVLLSSKATECETMILSPS